MEADTSIPINSEVRDDLRAEKRGGETYSETINRLLNPGEVDPEHAGERLRFAADIIRAVSEVAPVGDFDEETLEEYEAEYGEVPSIRDILRDLERETRELSILTEAHAEAGGGADD